MKYSTSAKHGFQVGQISFAEETHQKAQDNPLRKQQLAEEANNTFKEGDLVLLRRIDLEKEKGRKLEAHWPGPFLIYRVLNKRRSVIFCVTLGKQHVDNIKRFCPRSEVSRQEAA